MYVLLIIFTHTDGIIHLLLGIPWYKANTIYIVGRRTFGQWPWKSEVECFGPEVLYVRSTLGQRALEQKSIGAQPQKHIGAEAC